MTSELELYYANRLAMFETQGWKDLMEDVKTMEESINRLDGVTKDNLDARLGELRQIKWIKDLENVSRESYEQLKEQDASV